MKIKVKTLKNVIREAVEGQSGKLELTDVDDEQDLRMLELCRPDDHSYTSDSDAYFHGFNLAQSMIEKGVRHAFLAKDEDGDDINVYYGNDLNEIFKKNGWEQDPEYGDWTHPDET